jgi:hypothetical protein
MTPPRTSGEAGCPIKDDDQYFRALVETKPLIAQGYRWRSDLFHQDHLFYFNEIPSLHPVEVDATGETR